MAKTIRREATARELNRMAEQYEKRQGAQFKAAALTLRGLAEFYTNEEKPLCSSSAS